jgi:hypothetical protein
LKTTVKEIEERGHPQVLVAVVSVALDHQHQHLLAVCSVLPLPLLALSGALLQHLVVSVVLEPQHLHQVVLGAPLELLPLRHLAVSFYSQFFTSSFSNF